MKYKDSTASLDTARKILKVNHAGGWFMGFISALPGKNGVMACTFAVE
ncbi:demethoxyubiquinone hydroxylase family protein [Pseudomonas frederiksbergensis]|nr:demethoxyubiquinone hydroxylase family protein [Pseudomonas frederiksbergensis]